MNQTPSTVGDARIVVGLSGGVDSAVTAALLQEQGYAVRGVALRNWKAGAPEEVDSMEASMERARAVARHLDIPLVERDMRREFYTRVVEPFARVYAKGRTPNPCIFCNPTLKFATLLEEADATGARWIATGHYARVVHTEDEPSRLLRARARAKDQSYALYRLGQRELTRVRLPLGEMGDKSQVREIARRMGLPAAEADDSQDLCFIATGAHADLVGQLQPEAIAPGPIYDVEGHQIGEHNGLPHYTVGQRSGLRIAASERLYVLRLDPERNAVIAGTRAALETTTCRLSDVTFTVAAPKHSPFEALGRIRYHAQLVPIHVTLQPNAEADVVFDTPQYGLAPGQSLVFYQGEEILGGGVMAPTSLEIR
jgi:tRNA-uridine 2-sulfurtransferase